MKTIIFCFITIGIIAACGTGSDPINGTSECFGYEEESTSDYVLPYRANETFKVTQGNCSGDSHIRDSRYAYDFNFPENWPVIATRGGVVSDMEESRPTDDTSTPNWVEITHTDNTISRYQYLCLNCVDVALGATVAQGDLIARAGRLLHFSTFVRGAQGERITLPITFRNTTKHSIGLVQGEEYTSEPFVSEN